MTVRTVTIQVLYTYIIKMEILLTCHVPNAQMKCLKWIALIVAIVFLFCIGRTKTIEDYERGMDSQSMKDIE